MLPQTNRGLPQLNNRGMLEGLVNKESINMMNKKSLQNRNRNHRKKGPKKKQSKRVNQRKSRRPGNIKQLSKRSKTASIEPLVDQREQIKKQSNDLADEDNQSEKEQNELGQMSNRYENNLIKDFWESSEKESKEDTNKELYDNRKSPYFNKKVQFNTSYITSGYAPRGLLWHFK